MEDRETFSYAVEEVQETVAKAESYNFARRVLATIITDDLALCYSWLSCRDLQRPVNHSRRWNTTCYKEKKNSLTIVGCQQQRVIYRMKQLYPLPQVWRRKPTLSLPPMRNRYSQADAESMKDGRRKRSQEAAAIATQGRMLC